MTVCWNLQMNVPIFHQGHHVNLWDNLHNLCMIEFHLGDNVLNHKNDNNLLPALHHLHKEQVMKEEGSDKREDDPHHHHIYLLVLMHPTNHNKKGNVNQEDQKDGALNMNVLGTGGLKSLKREKKASLSLTTMEPMVK